VTQPTNPLTKPESEKPEAILEIAKPSEPVAPPVPFPVPPVEVSPPIAPPSVVMPELPLMPAPTKTPVEPPIPIPPTPVAPPTAEEVKVTPRIVQPEQIDRAKLEQLLRGTVRPPLPPEESAGEKEASATHRIVPLNPTVPPLESKSPVEPIVPHAPLPKVPEPNFAPTPITPVIPGWEGVKPIPAPKLEMPTEKPAPIPPLPPLPPIPPAPLDIPSVEPASAPVPPLDFPMTEESRKQQGSILAPMPAEQETVLIKPVTLGGVKLDWEDSGSLTDTNDLSKAQLSWDEEPESMPAPRLRSDPDGIVKPKRLILAALEFDPEESASPLPHVRIDFEADLKVLTEVKPSVPQKPVSEGKPRVPPANLETPQKPRIHMTFSTNTAARATGYYQRSAAELEHLRSQITAVLGSELVRVETDTSMVNRLYVRIYVQPNVDRDAVLDRVFTIPEMNDVFIVPSVINVR
jgi:hypothetical protein